MKSIILEIIKIYIRKYVTKSEINRFFSDN